ESLEMSGGDGNPQHWKNRFGSQHSWQVGGPAGTCNDAAQSASGGIFGIAVEEARMWMSGHDAGFIFDLEIMKPPGRVLHHVPVGVAAHHDAHHGLRHLHPPKDWDPSITFERQDWRSDGRPGPIH